jgi:hypothetical protein
MPDPNVTTAFIDPTTIGTFSVASGGLFTFTATIRKVFNWSHLGLPLLMAQLISFGLAAKGESLGTFLGWLIALLNGCMLFMSVVGLNETLTPRPAGQSQQQGTQPQAFFQSFF